MRDWKSEAMEYEAIDRAMIDRIDAGRAMAEAFAEHEAKEHGVQDPEPVPVDCLVDVAARYDRIRAEGKRESEPVDDGWIRQAEDAGFGTREIAIVAKHLGKEEGR